MKLNKLSAVSMISVENLCPNGIRPQDLLSVAIARSKEWAIKEGIELELDSLTIKTSTKGTKLSGSGAGKIDVDPCPESHFLSWLSICASAQKEQCAVTVAPTSDVTDWLTGIVKGLKPRVEPKPTPATA